MRLAKSCEVKSEMVANSYKAYYTHQPMTEIQEKEKGRKALLATLVIIPPDGEGVLSMIACCRSLFSRRGLPPRWLTSAERSVVESGFRARYLSVMATSTLATGVNLPADLVIIASRFQGNVYDICNIVRW